MIAQADRCQAVRRAIPSLVVTLPLIGSQAARPTTFQMTPGDVPYLTVSAAVAADNLNPSSPHVIIIPAGEYTPNIPGDDDTLPIGIPTTEVTFFGSDRNKTIINAEGTASISVVEGPPTSLCTATSTSDISESLPFLLMLKRGGCNEVFRSGFTGSLFASM